MAYFGEHGAPLFLVYVWVTLANGFRFGPRYLLISLGAEPGRLRRGARDERILAAAPASWASG